MCDAINQLLQPAVLLIAADLESLIFYTSNWHFHRQQTFQMAAP